MSKPVLAGLRRRNTKMARMHSRKKGKSGSTKPAKGKEKPWVTHSAAEVEQLVVKLAKAEHAPSMIGVVLRDSYGIPDVKEVTGKKITKILSEAKHAPELPEQLSALIKRQILLLKHLEGNKQDKPARRGLVLTESKIKRLTKYYKKKGILAKDWTYNPEQARLIVG